MPKLEDDVMKKFLQLYCGPWLSNLSGQKVYIYLGWTTVSLASLVTVFDSFSYTLKDFPDNIRSFFLVTI